MDDIDPRLRPLQEALADLQRAAASHDTELLQSSAARAYECMCLDTHRELTFLHEAFSALRKATRDEIQSEVVIAGTIIRANALLETYFNSLMRILFRCSEVERHLESIPIADWPTLVRGSVKAAELNRNAKSAARQRGDIHWADMLEELRSMGVLVELDSTFQNKLDDVRYLRNRVAHGEPIAVELVDSSRKHAPPILKTQAASAQWLDPDPIGSWTDAAEAIEVCEKVVREIDVAVSRDLFDEEPFMDNLEGGPTWL